MSAVFFLLLLSAVNTAIVALIGISFLMSRDGELPPRFQKLNEFGVPNLGLLVATIIPAILVLAVKDVSGLADLYAVGVVGAIATNLGACSTDRKLGLVASGKRTLMFCDLSHHAWPSSFHFLPGERSPRPGSSPAPCSSSACSCAVWPANMRNGPKRRKVGGGCAMTGSASRPPSPITTFTL